jgi:uncharacterized protein (TIGR00369 family)
VTDGSIGERSRFDRLRSSQLRAPLRVLAGLRYLDHGPGRLEEAMDVPPWLRDDSGAVSPGALLILADSTLAAAVATTIDGDHVPVTRRLGFELLTRAPVSADTVVAAAAVVRAEGGRAAVRGELHAGGGVVAIASMRAAVVVDRGRPDAPVGERGARPPSDGTASTIGEVWPLELVSAADGTTVVRVPVPPWQANSIGTLHGGVVAAIGERALRAAVVGTLPPRGRATILDVVVECLRPVAADGDHVEVRTEIVHRTDRFAVAQARVARADGAIAALVRLAAELVEDGVEGRRGTCSSG